MGLNVTHDAFDGAYSAFNRLRQFVAKGMCGSFPPHKDNKLDDNLWYWGDGYNKEVHQGLWIFLSHSDCDGEISSEDCLKVANDLECLLPKLEDLVKIEPVAGGHIAGNGGYIACVKRFIDGCRLANKLNEPLEFR